MDVARYSGSFRLIGPPGTGKTSWLRRQVRAINDDDRVLSRGTNLLLCSLTKTAAKEIIRTRPGEDDLPISASSVGTLHAHCYRALDKPDLAELNIEDWNERHPETALGKGSVQDMDDSSEYTGDGIGDRVFMQYSLLRARMDPVHTWPDEVREFDREWTAWKSDLEVVDFTDLIETCLQDQDCAPGYPRQIMADEGQDLSALEYALIRKWGAQAQAEFIVGDPWQALYVWRGARPDLFFDPEIAKDHVKTLSQSYRVPVVIHSLAMKWMQGLSDYHEIVYNPRDEEGRIYGAAATWRDPEAAVRGAIRHIENGRTVMIMASCSFQLSFLLDHLKYEGIPFSNPWRPKRGDWNPVRLRLKGSSSRRVADYLRCDWKFELKVTGWTLAQFGNWIDLIKAKDVLNHGVKADIKFEVENAGDDRVTLQDLARFFTPSSFDDLTLLLDESNAHSETSTDDLLDWLERNVKQSKRKPTSFAIRAARRSGPKILTADPRLYVGTIHSFKGAEADVVYLFPDLSSSMQKEWLGGGSGRDNIIRMFYVAMTRSKDTLVVCRSCGPTPVNLFH